MRFLKSAQAGLLHLRREYAKGRIKYPRTDNDYHPAEYSPFFAHPRLDEIDHWALPLSESEYPLNENTVCLHLSNEKMLRAAGISRMATFLAKLYDRDLNPYPEKVQELRRIVRLHGDVIDRLKDSGFGVRLKKNGNIDLYETAHTGEMSHLPHDLIFCRIPLSPELRKKRGETKSNKKEEKGRGDRFSPRFENFSSQAPVVTTYQDWDSMERAILPVLLLRRLQLQNLIEKLRGQKKAQSGEERSMAEKGETKKGEAFRRVIGKIQKTNGEDGSSPALL